MPNSTLPRCTAALALLALLSPMTAGSTARADQPRRAAPRAKRITRPVLRDGERLFYRAYAWKGATMFGTEVGTATITTRHGTDRSGAPVWRISARASGSTMGNSIDARAVATLSEHGQPRRYEENIAGDRKVRRALMFGPRELLYLKTKHCHGCKDHAHHITETQGSWFGMGGTEVAVHCDDRHCGDGEHRIWKVRHRHPADTTAGDPLSALFRARALDLRLGAPARTLRIAVGHAVFDVKIVVLKRAAHTVPAGTFDALQLSLTPTPAPGIPGSPRFQGLFGMSGTLEIWVDAARKIPLRISGTVPMGVDVNAVVVLAKIDVPKAATPGATKKRAR
jgi:hypothetical protein